MRLSQRAVVRGIRKTEDILVIIGMGMFFVLMLIGAFDVIGRYVFNRPITGTLELSKILIVGLVMFGLAHTQAKGAHVRVELVVARLRPRVQAIIGFLMLFLSLALFSLITWQATVVVIESWQSGKSIFVLGIPTAGVQLVVPLGAFFLCLELIIQMFRLLPEMRKAG